MRVDALAVIYDHQSITRFLYIQPCTSRLCPSSTLPHRRQEVGLPSLPATMDRDTTEDLEKQSTVNSEAQASEKGETRTRLVLRILGFQTDVDFSLQWTLEFQVQLFASWLSQSSTPQGLVG